MKMPPTFPAPQPIVLETKTGRRDGQVIAFLGKQICIFERDCGAIAGVKTSVMFTRVHYTRMQDGTTDFHKVSIVFIRPVTSAHILVPHSGFECSGSMCATTASVYFKRPDGNWEYDGWMTPGRVGVFEASNINRSDEPLRPGYCYVDRLKYNRREFPLRCEGLIRPEDAMWANAIRK